MEEKLEAILIELRDIKNAVKETNTKFDLLTAKVTNLEEQYENITEEVKTLKNENTRLRQNLEVLEQYSRNNNMIISGIPEQKGENLYGLFSTLAAKLKIEYDKSDIDTAHRLPSSSPAPPPIIVKFVSRDVKNAWIRASKKEKLHGSALSMTPALPIFCSDHLTPNTKQLFSGAQYLRGKGAVKYVWIRNGNVFMRKIETSPSIKIREIAHLETLFNEFGVDLPTSSEGKPTTNELETHDEINASKKRTLADLSPEKTSITKMHTQKTLKTDNRNFSNRVNTSINSAISNTDRNKTQHTLKNFNFVKHSQNKN